MNIHQLEYFVAAAEYQNFTKAAEKFYISQTAITMQIRSLESHLGVSLFERSGRHVRLTLAGQVYLEEAKSILHHISESERKVQLASSGYMGTIKVGVLKGCEQMGVARILSEFTELYSGISFLFIREDYEDLFQSLDVCENDVILNLRPKKLPSQELELIDFRHAWQYAVLPVGHPLASRTSLLRAELKDESFVLLNTSDSTLAFVQDGFLASGFLPASCRYTSDVESILLMVAANMGIAIIPGFDLHLIRGFSTLQAIPLEAESELLTVSFFRNPRNKNQAADHFMEFLREKLPAPDIFTP